MDTLLGFLYQLAPIAVACIVAFAGYWINRLKKLSEKKLSAETAQLVNALLDIQVAKSVYFAEEWSHKKAKEGAEKTSGDAKLGVAVGFVMSQLEAHGFQDWAEGKSEHVAGLIEAKVFEKRKEDTKVEKV